VYRLYRRLQAGPYWSLMFEVSESQFKPVNQEPVQLGGKTWCVMGAGGRQDAVRALGAVGT
jgi:uncharacterized protein affecting Mg2+/Co2+ transport